MNAETLANVIQVVATLIALVGLAVTFVFSYRGQRLQKEQAMASAAQAAESNRAAQAAAQRAAAAAALTIDDLARIAAAVEKIASERVVAGPAAPAGTRFEAPAAPAAAAWRLTHDGGDGYRLTNVGGAPAFDVWVGGAASLDGPHGVAPGALVAAGAALSFRAAVLPTTDDSTITVTWAATEGGKDRASWRYPLPGA